MAKKTNITVLPKVYAHRGASADRPEHTMEAYEEGLRQGADGFECDVRLTEDGIPILWHDSTMDRTAGATGDIANLTFDEIRNRYPKVATLDELLDFVITHKKGLLIETKHPVPTTREIEKVVATRLRDRQQVIEKAGISISMMSFSWSAVESFRRKNPEFNTVMLLNPRTTRLKTHFSSAQTWGPGIEQLKQQPELARRAKAQGKKIFVWTVDETPDVLLCAEIGVDIVITNKPALARKALGYS
jgi:glycerophosphoryl diester phosphodiesterase